MKLLTAAILILCVCACVSAENKQTFTFPETVTLKDPGAVSKHRFGIAPGSDYAFSAKVKSSAARTAVVEIRLFSKNKQCKFLRSFYSSTGGSTVENVFNAGKADRIEISLCIIDDAMPGATAQFTEIQLIPCESTITHPWSRNSQVNCGRKIVDNGRKVILYPPRRGVGYTSASFGKLPKNCRLRFSARARAELPGMASIAANCGARNTRSRNFGSKWSTSKDQVHSIEFDVDNAEWTTLVLRCLSSKKNRGPVEFSEIKIEIVPRVSPEKTTVKSAK